MNVLAGCSATPHFNYFSISDLKNWSACSKIIKESQVRYGYLVRIMLIKFQTRGAVNYVLIFHTESKISHPINVRLGYFI